MEEKLWFSIENDVESFLILQFFLFCFTSNFSSYIHSFEIFQCGNYKSLENIFYVELFIYFDWFSITKNFLNVEFFVVSEESSIQFTVLCPISFMQNRLLHYSNNHFRSCIWWFDFFRFVLMIKPECLPHIFCSKRGNLRRGRWSHKLPCRLSWLHPLLHVWRRKKTSHAMSIKSSVQSWSECMWLARKCSKLFTAHSKTTDG